MQHFFLLLSAAFLSVLTSSAQNWVDKTALPGTNGRNHPVSWALDGFGYSVTGATQITENTKDFFKYNPATDSWEQLPDFPGSARTYSIGDVYEGKGYMGFGSNNSGVLNDLWRYDPATGNWQELATCPCSGRQHPTFTINKENGKIYVGEGNNENSNLKDWWEYDIATNTWAEKAEFPGTSRHHPFHFSIGDYSYSGLGHDGSQVMATSDLYRYNPATDTWTQMADAPGRRIAGTQFDFGGYGFVLSGEGDYHRPTTPSIFWKYDPAANTWSELQSHPGGSLWAPGSFIINSTLYLFGGVYRPNGPEVYSQKMWAYDLQNAVSIRDKQKDKTTLQLYPNPVKQLLHVNMGDLQTAKQMRVYDITGRSVYTEVVSNKRELSIRTESFVPGNYFVELTADAGIVATGRFVKQ